MGKHLWRSPTFEDVTSGRSRRRTANSPPRLYDRVTWPACRKPGLAGAFFPERSARSRMELLAQLPFQHLTDRTARQCIDESQRGEPLHLPQTRINPG